jgi:diguanylate cyclase (GGDEF)-like protein
MITVSLALPLTGAAAAAVAACALWQIGYSWAALLMLAPAYLNWRQFRLVTKHDRGDSRQESPDSHVHVALVQALARAIDAKDHASRSHVPRVQIYAVGLARAAHLPPAEIDAIGTAALLHDVGKLAVPEHILSKPGPLTAEEFEKVRIHPQIGADLIASVPFPRPVAPIVRSHHERWDGKGYPDGLKAEEIPVGARILAIADYFEAVTSGRPYHKPLPYRSAVGLLTHEAGRALDPQLVPIFVEALPALVDQAEAADTREAAQPIPAEAFEHIALAHREIFALYEVARSMGTSLAASDTIALITSKIAGIVPWHGCALFLCAADGSMQCRYVAGLDMSPLLDGLLAPGEGLEGWVAQKQRALVNADPRATFDALGLQTRTMFNSAIVCPLHSSDLFIGCLTLYHQAPHPYTDDHRRLLERIAEQAGPVLHNSILFERTQEDSLTDPLTSLPNRRAMIMHLSRELARAERLKSEVALIVLDVDEFKGLNDTGGHHIGDRALRQVAAALQEALRPYDLCSRYAGDEFIIVLAECPHDEAELRCRDLQRRIAELEIEVTPGATVHLAASAGAAVYPVDGTTYEALLAEADHRMYRDKAARRRQAALVASSSAVRDGEDDSLLRRSQGF